MERARWSLVYLCLNQRGRRQRWWPGGDRGRQEARDLVKNWGASAHDLMALEALRQRLLAESGEGVS